MPLVRGGSQRLGNNLYVAQTVAAGIGGAVAKVAETVNPGAGQTPETQTCSENPSNFIAAADQESIARIGRLFVFVQDSNLVICAIVRVRVPAGRCPASEF